MKAVGQDARRQQSTTVSPARPLAQRSTRGRPLSHVDITRCRDDIATSGTAYSSSPLPFLERIEHSFGTRLREVRTQTGDAAGNAARALGAEAYAVGDRIAFTHSPTLRIAAHEAAHIVQQRHGLRRASAEAERSADAAADAVLAGRSASAALGRPTGLPTTVVQMQTVSSDVIDAFSAGGQAAGPVNLAAVLAALQKVQRMEDLIATLEQIDQMNELEELHQYWLTYASNDMRLKTAYDVVIEIGRRNATNVPAAALDRVVDETMHLDSGDQAGVVDYVASRAGKSEAEIEGIVAQLSKSSDESADPIIAAAPAGIGPGPWAPPGNQWEGFYIGSEAHKEIAAYYQMAHPTDVVLSNFSSIGSILTRLEDMGVSVARAGLGLRADLGLMPDITNLSRLMLYEIKPVTQSLIAFGKADSYAAIFKSMGIDMKLGPSADPGVIGVVPAPAGYYRFWSPRPGVIVYEYKKGPYVPVPYYHPQEQEEPSLARERVKEGAKNAGKLAVVGTVLYWVVSESSRVLFPPRNLIPAP